VLELEPVEAFVYLRDARLRGLVLLLQVGETVAKLADSICEDGARRVVRTIRQCAVL